MDIVFNILQGLVGLAFLAAGGMKLAQGKEKILAMGDNMAWAGDFSDMQVRLIGLAEVLGGLALILALFISIPLMLLLGGIAGICLAILMAGAAYTHVRRNEMSAIVPNIVLGLLALVVAFTLLV